MNETLKNQGTDTPFMEEEQVDEVIERVKKELWEKIYAQEKTVVPGSGECISME